MNGCLLHKFFLSKNTAQTKRLKTANLRTFFSSLHDFAITDALISRERQAAKFGFF